MEGDSVKAVQVTDVSIQENMSIDIQTPNYKMTDEINSLPLASNEETSNQVTSTLKSIESDSGSTEVDMKIIFWLKISYFISGTTYSAWGRFSTIYYTIIGFSSEQIALCEGLGLISSLIFSFILSAVADKIRSKKKVFILSFIIGTVSFSMLSIDTLANKDHFVIISFIIMIGYGMTGFDFLNAYTLDYIGNQQHLYGELRLWLAFGWGISNPIIFFLYYAYNSFKLNFSMMIMINIIFIIIILNRLPNKTLSEKKVDSAKINFKLLIKVFLRVKIILFFLNCIIVNICFAFVEKFIFVYLTVDLQGSVLLSGMTIFVTVMFEIPVFYYSDYLLKKFSYINLVTIASLSHLIRMIGYLSLSKDNAWLILLFETCHGFTFATINIAVMDLIKKISPEELITSVNGITQIILYVGSNCIGLFCGGYLMDNFGGKFLYTISAIAMLISFSINLIISLCLKKRIIIN